MNESVATTIPLIARLGSIVHWVMLLNVLLIGAVVFLGHRVAALSRRVRELELMGGEPSDAPEDSAPVEEPQHDPPETDVGGGE